MKVETSMGKQQESKLTVLRFYQAQVIDYLIIRYSEFLEYNLKRAVKRISVCKFDIRQEYKLKNNRNCCICQPSKLMKLIRSKIFVCISSKMQQTNTKHLRCQISKCCCTNPNMNIVAQFGRREHTKKPTACLICFSSSHDEAAYCSQPNSVINSKRKTKLVIYSI